MNLLKRTDGAALFEVGEGDFAGHCNASIDHRSWNALGSEPQRQLIGLVVSKHCQQAF